MDNANQPTTVDDSYQFPGWKVLEQKLAESPIEIREFLESLADEIEREGFGAAQAEQIMSLVGRC